MIGRPVHLKKKGNSNWTACGVQSDLAAWDCRHVECLRCRRTKLWKAGCGVLRRVASTGHHQKTPKLERPPRH